MNVDIKINIDEIHRLMLSKSFGDIIDIVDTKIEVDALADKIAKVINEFFKEHKDKTDYADRANLFIIASRALQVNKWRCDSNFIYNHIINKAIKDKNKVTFDEKATNEK